MRASNRRTRPQEEEKDPLETGAILRILARRKKRPPAERPVTPAEHKSIAADFAALLEATPAPRALVEEATPRRRRNAPTTPPTVQDDEEDEEEAAPPPPPPPAAATKKKKRTPAPRKRRVVDDDDDVHDDDDDAPLQTTRSGRRSFRALDWWKSERIAYDADGNAAGVVKDGNDDTATPRSTRRRRVPSSA
mmetsp:Transcript_17303/g.52646  ORF Transcript_17303/g.52646 Transcript_17303/m.52646 type:complete len:192 (+) Transcript_17303:40-615(+)